MMNSPTPPSAEIRLPGPTSPRLLILGASARAAAFSARRAGRHPVTCDLFADRDLGQFATAHHVPGDQYPAALFQFAHSRPPLPWIYTGGLENYPEQIERLAQTHPHWGCSAEAVRKVRSLDALAEALVETGVCVPETRRSPPPVGDSHQWLVKSTRSAGGRHVHSADSPRPSDGTNRSVVWQRRILGRVCSAVFVGDGETAGLLGTTELHCGDRRNGGRGWTYSGSIGPLSAAAVPLQQVAQLGRTLARRFSLIGLFGADLIHADDGLYLLEVNPRYTASIEVLERALGIASIAWHAAVCGGQLDPAALPEPNAHPAPPTEYSGKRIVYARQPVTITSRQSDWVLEQNGNADPWRPAWADIPPPGTSVAVGSPVLTVLADGEDLADVEQRLAARVALIQQRWGI